MHLHSPRPAGTDYKGGGFVGSLPEAWSELAQVRGAVALTLCNNRRLQCQTRSQREVRGSTKLLFVTGNMECLASYN